MKVRPSSSLPCGPSPKTSHHISENPTQNVQPCGTSILNPNTLGQLQKLQPPTPKSRTLNGTSPIQLQRAAPNPKRPTPTPKKPTPNVQPCGIAPLRPRRAAPTRKRPTRGFQLTALPLSYPTCSPTQKFKPQPQKAQPHLYYRGTSILQPKHAGPSNKNPILNSQMLHQLPYRLALRTSSPTCSPSPETSNSNPINPAQNVQPQLRKDQNQTSNRVIPPHLVN